MIRVEPKIGRYNWYLSKERKRFERRPEIQEHREEEEESSPSEEEDYYEITRPSKDYDEEWPTDYWEVKKLTAYIKRGNPVLSSLALICLRSCDFSNPITLQAIKDDDELHIILNLLRCDHLRVQAAALTCLARLAAVKSIRYEIVYFGGLQDMVALLWEPNSYLKLEVAKAIAEIAIFQRARRIVRLSNGIPLLAHMLYEPDKHLSVYPENLTVEEKVNFDAAAAAAKALNILCEDNKCKKELWKCGALLMCKRIVNSKHIRLITAVIGLLQTCAGKKYFRIATRKLGILESIRRHLYSEDRELTQISAQAVFKCAEDIDSREFFGQKGFVEKIYEVIAREENHGDEELMSSVTGALWKCAKSVSNVVRLHSLGAVPVLLSLLSLHYIKVQVHIIGCLALCFRHPPCCQAIIKHNGIDTMVKLLSTTHGPLIVNLGKAMAEASHDQACMKIIEKLDAIEKVWSHLRHNDLWVVSNTAWSLCPILENISDSAAYVRSLIGGVEVIVNLLVSPYTRIATPACKIVSILSRHKENLSLLTDYGVVRLLSAKVTTKCRRLRYYLCMAIYSCCPSKSNAVEFGHDNIVRSVVRILKSKTPEVREAACRVLWRLSVMPRCCQLIYQSRGTLKILLNLMDKEEIQDWAAGIIQNIRLFSLVREDNLTEFLETRMSQRRRVMISHMGQFDQFE